MSILSYHVQGGGNNTILHIPFEKLGFDNYFACLIIVVILAAIYLSIGFSLIAIKRGKNEN